MKDIYILPVSEAELITEEYCLENFPIRTKKAKGYRFREDKLRCIGAGALLCGIAGIKENELAYNEYGKPICNGKNFSISHSGIYSVIALSDGIVGVDIERISRKHTGIAKRVCASDEMEWLEGTTGEEEKTERFFKLWTVKESIMKAEGKGFAMDPRDFSILPIIEGGSAVVNGREYFGESFRLDDYILSVCNRSREPAQIFHITKEML